METAEERVVYNYYTGRPDEVVSDVLRSISAYTREDRVRFFKIGITNDPERRFQEAYAKHYDKMFAVYQSTSISSVSRLEDELVEHNRDLAENILAGGGGNIGRSPYYLYVVVKYNRL
jgi:uncharacterized protein (DUF488 family)